MERESKAWQELAKRFERERNENAADRRYLVDALNSIRHAVGLRTSYANNLPEETAGVIVALKAELSSLRACMEEKSERRG